SPLFSVEERVNILENITGDIPNVKIQSFGGLSVNFAKSCEAKVIIRGLRAITDFEYELQMAQTNRILSTDVDTMFLTTSLQYAYLSSTTVKEAASFGADISKFVPEYVVRQVEAKLSGMNHGK
ncbi:MAG: pantetheine-phosphate adenylyltransferase, partial [Blautia producta]